ncbi:MAG: class I SAM-dependent methyltransferase [Actinomycetota bacterium]
MASYDPRTPADRPVDHVEFGPGLGADVDRRLLSEVKGKRILDLGCGAGHTAVGLARRGARVVATDDDGDQLAAARTLAAHHEVTVEFHEARPAELAFIRADQIDVAVSVWALSFVDDLDRVFRQVHRVLKTNGHAIVALPHPAALCADPVDPARTTRSWTTTEPIGGRYVHTVEGVVTAFTRTNFAVEIVLERHAGGLLPEALVVRARRLGA